jgi:hypothetical protein
VKTGQTVPPLFSPYRLLFPIGNLDEGAPLLVELFDKDFAGYEFLGQVGEWLLHASAGFPSWLIRSFHAAAVDQPFQPLRIQPLTKQVIMTLGKALQIAEDAAAARAYWFQLAKKRSTDIVGGELCLGFEIMGSQGRARAAARAEAEMDPDQIASTLGRRALHVQLHGLNGLRANNLQLPVGWPGLVSRAQRVNKKAQSRVISIRSNLDTRRAMLRRLPPATRPRSGRGRAPSSSGLDGSAWRSRCPRGERRLKPLA